mgnify:CR=1 FL=1
MVEEIRTLERKDQCSSKSTAPSKSINLSSENHPSVHPHLTEKHFEIINRHRDPETHSKRTRLDPVPREDQNREQLGLHCAYLMPPGSNQMINFDGQHLRQLGHHSPALSSHEQNTGGLSWPAQGQMIPFWLARQ